MRSDWVRWVLGDADEAVVALAELRDAVRALDEECARLCPTFETVLGEEADAKISTGIISSTDKLARRVLNRQLDWIENAERPGQRRFVLTEEDLPVDILHFETLSADSLPDWINGLFRHGLAQKIEAVREALEAHQGTVRQRVRDLNKVLKSRTDWRVRIAGGALRSQARDLFREARIIRSATVARILKTLNDRAGAIIRSVNRQIALQVLPQTEAERRRKARVDGALRELERGQGFALLDLRDGHEFGEHLALMQAGYLQRLIGHDGTTRIAVAQGDGWT